MSENQYARATYSREDVIDLILQERNRCREICDSHSEWFQRRIDDFGKHTTLRYEEGKDACRRIRISISDTLPLLDERTDEEKIIERYKL